MHARNLSRKNDIEKEVPSAIVLMADPGDIQQTIRLAGELNGLGRFHAVIHNAGVYTASSRPDFEWMVRRDNLSK